MQGQRIALHRDFPLPRYGLSGIGRPRQGDERVSQILRPRSTQDPPRTRERIVGPCECGLGPGAEANLGAHHVPIDTMHITPV